MRTDHPEAGLPRKVYRRTGAFVTRRIAGEFILVPISGDLANLQRIFTLTPVAEFIWERLDGRRDLGEIRDEVVARFDVEGNRADADVLSFLEELVAANLVREAES